MPNHTGTVPLLALTVNHKQKTSQCENINGRQKENSRQKEFKRAECFLIFFFSGTGICTQGFRLAKQALYHLSYTSSTRKVKIAFMYYN
jgi:hypothetical protein